MESLEQTIRDELESLTRRLNSAKVRRRGGILVRATGIGAGSHVIENSIEGARLRLDSFSAGEDIQAEIIGDTTQILSILRGKEDAREAFQSGRIQVRGNFGYLNEVLLELGVVKRPIYYLLRVTAVLTAKKDGTQSLGEIVRGGVRPASPYLRDPSIHIGPDDNYVKDWISLANLQLLSSGACFGLDVENLRYVIEPNDFLYTRECWDNSHAATVDWLAMKAAEPIVDNPYRDSVIIIFRWGKGSQPSGQACSGLDYPYILMSGKYYNIHNVDGWIVTGSNQLTHELGHFMGLDHTFPYRVVERLAVLSSLRGRNRTNLPVTVENFPGDHEALQVYEARALAERYIATWPGGLDPDAGGRPTLPDSVIVDDTPADLGPALPLLFGFPGCGDSTSYIFNRYDPAWLEPLKDGRGNPVKDADGNVIWWQPKPGAEEHLYQESILIDESVRHNVMSYWLCDPSSQRFSVDQVRRMNFVLTERRQNLIGRTIKLYEDFARIRELILVQAAEARSRLLHVNNEFQRSTKVAVPAALHQCGVQDKSL